jgi:predicted RNase H-like HicB family nuclease
VDPALARFRAAGLYDGSMPATREVRIPYILEQDEDGAWCAHAQLQPQVGAHGEGATADEAVTDLREALSGLIAEFGVPQELTLTLDVA